jgi:energy-coupling factor transport system permease protein
MRGLAVPVLEGALDRSLDLAASMDSRGYGRHGEMPAARRRAAQVTTLFGALAIMIGVFALLDSGAPFALGVPMVAAGAVLLSVSVNAARSAASRSRYRPDVWAAPEWITVAAGACALAALVVAGHHNPDALRPPFSPLRAPTLPLLPTLGILVAAVPAFGTPPLPVELA